MIAVGRERIISDGEDSRCLEIHTVFLRVHCAHTGPLIASIHV